MELEEFRREFRTLDHPDVVVAMVPAYAAGAKFVLDYLADAIGKGTVFSAGQTIQIGWMMIMLKDAPGGALEVYEPQFGAMPIVWVRGANNTYRHLMLQNELCRKLGVEPEYPSLRQSGVVSPAFLTNGATFQMSRDAPNGNDSGWVFSELNYSGSAGRLCSLFEIASAVPGVVMHLALPPDSSVRNDGRRVDISSSGRMISTADDDALRTLLGVPHT